MVYRYESDPSLGWGSGKFLVREMTSMDILCGKLRVERLGLWLGLGLWSLVLNGSGCGDVYIYVFFVYADDGGIDVWFWVR